MRESEVMGREGGAKGGNAEPLPVSKDSILSCPEHRSDDVGFEGVKSTVPGDERGSEYFFRPVMDRPKPTLGPSIPCGVRFSQWVEAHRESCGFGDLKPSGAAKRPQPPMSYQRQAKR